MLYPIAIEKGDDDNSFGVVVPDLQGCFSAGDSFEEALVNAKEAIELYLTALAESGEMPPLATSIDEHYHKQEFNGWVWALSEVDIEPYQGQASKINVTLPNLLTKHIDDLVSTSDKYKSRSHFLQLAARHEYEKARV